MIVAIDELSVDALGRWPWRRSVIADLLDRITESGASVVGFDILFSEPEIVPELQALRAVRDALDHSRTGLNFDSTVLSEALHRADTDRQLEEAIGRSGRTVLGYFFRTAKGEASAVHHKRPPLERRLPGIKKSRIGIVRVPVATAMPVLRCVDVEPNLERFHRVANRLGFFSVLHDPDGVLRRAPLVASCGDHLYVSLSLAMVETLADARAMVIGDAHGLHEIRVGRASIPTDEGGRILINYRGPAGSFPQYSAVDVLEGRVARAALKGTAVLVGPTEPGIMDIHTTPFGPGVPGVEVHANVIDNVLAGSALRRHDGLVLAEFAILVVSGLLLITVVPRTGGAVRGAFFAAVVLALIAGGIIFAFLARGLWINLAYPVISVLVTYVVLAVAQSVTVEVRGRRIRRAFATYVPPDVVNELVRHPESLRLGGERRDLSILFSDIRGFTGLSEELGPERVVELLNAYLTPMTRVVFETRGTLDKYIGDAIVAFWGAPLPLSDHPRRACEAALGMQGELERLQRERSDLQGIDSLRVGMGIHCAEVVVGNMGSELRFDYTVMGDGVNICSRLEGLTKYYGVGILASAELVDRLPPTFLVRELDTIRVKGREEAVRIFQVLGCRAPDRQEAVWLESYAAGLRAYRMGHWTEAATAFREARASHDAGDPACDLLLARMRSLERAPEADPWDGVWSFEVK